VPAFPSAKPRIVYATTENDPIDVSRALKAVANEFLMVPFNRNSIEAKFPHGAFTA